MAMATKLNGIAAPKEPTKAELYADARRLGITGSLADERSRSQAAVGAARLSEPTPIRGSGSCTRHGGASRAGFQGGVRPGRAGLICSAVARNPVARRLAHRIWGAQAAIFASIRDAHVRTLVQAWEGAVAGAIPSDIPNRNLCVLKAATTLLAHSSKSGRAPICFWGSFVDTSP